MLGIHSIINGSLVALSIEPWVGKFSDILCIFKF